MLLKNGRVLFPKRKLITFFRSHCDNEKTEYELIRRHRFEVMFVVSTLSLFKRKLVQKLHLGLTYNQQPLAFLLFSNKFKIKRTAQLVCILVKSMDEIEELHLKFCSQCLKFG